VLLAVVTCRWDATKKTRPSSLVVGFEPLGRFFLLAGVVQTHTFGFFIGLQAKADRKTVVKLNKSLGPF